MGSPKDVVGAGSSEVLVEKTSVGRTFAYTVSVLAQMLWIVITTLLLITDDEGHESERAWWDSDPNKHSFDFWENMSHDTGKLLPCLLLPLLIIVPPIFSRGKHRALSTLVLCGLGLLLGSLHLLATLVWLVQAEQDALKRRAPELFLTELTSVVLTLLLAFVLHSTYRTWNQVPPPRSLCLLGCLVSCGGDHLERQSCRRGSAPLLVHHAAPRPAAALRHLPHAFLHQEPRYSSHRQVHS